MIYGETHERSSKNDYRRNIEAIDIMQKMVKYYIWQVSEMLSYIDTDEWSTMSAEEKERWVKHYL